MQKVFVLANVMLVVVLSACGPASQPVATPSTNSTAVTAPAGISPEMMQRLTRIPSFIKLKPGNAVPAFAPMAVNLPNGETKQLDLKGMLNGKRGLIYFYVLDDTPL